MSKAFFLLQPRYRTPEDISFYGHHDLWPVWLKVAWGVCQRGVLRNSDHQGLCNPNVNYTVYLP